MTKGALVVGGSIAGLQAALDLAESGIRVHLVEESSFLSTGPASWRNGGSSAVPPHLLNTRLLEVAKHPHIRVWTNTRVNRAEREGGRFRIELRRHPRYVDMTKCTACGDCIAVCPVSVPGTDHKAIHLDPNAQPGCAAIDKLGKPPCSNTCPGGIHVQGYVALIAQGRFQEAIDLIRQAIPFPGICGRICTHPCEVNCRRAEVDAPVAIRLLKRFVSDWELQAAGTSPAAKSPAGRDAAGEEPKRVAIVGAGPAGMAVADRLARLGYQVTVFEKLPVIGGMMAVGIPEYRLPRQVIAREYQLIQDLGVEVRLNTSIGVGGDYTVDDLFNMGYAAVCLAVGAHRSHDLRIQGETLPGVIQGIDFLKIVSLAQQVADAGAQARLQQALRKGAKTRAVVLGGGNTAMDVSRSLRRLGVKDVRILYRRTRTEMPALPEEIEGAEQEGVAIEYLVSPVRVLGNAESGVTGLECVRMKLGEPDSSGRRRPVPIAGSEFVIKLDLVVPAIGQAADLEFLGQDHGVAITREERINVDGLSFMTSRPGVFAAGDAVTTDKMAVIEAIGMGKRAAAAIDDYIRGIPVQDMAVDAREVPIARRAMTDAELTPKPRIPVSTVPVAARVRSYDEVELGYTAEQAMAEAQRCLVCGPCSECLACVRACKPGAVVHEQHEQFIDLDIGAVIYAGDPARFDHLRLPESQGVYAVPPGNPLIGSAAAARAMFDLFADRQITPVGPAPVRAAASGPPGPGGEPARVGVFVCQCGGQISDVVDTDAVAARASLWPDVVHSQVLPFSCSGDAAQAMADAVSAHGLNRAVLAACSCCSIDQVCFSCTYQRVRCRQNLGVLRPPSFVAAGAVTDSGPPESATPPGTDTDWLAHASTGSGIGIPFEFVNIREQCAWVHADDPQAATATATAMVAAAVARARIAVTPPGLEVSSADRKESRSASGADDRSVLILGTGAAARACQKALDAQSVGCQRLETVPARVWRAAGCYHLAHKGATHQAAALVLAPQDAGEAARLLAAFGEDGLRPRVQGAWGGLDTHRPGVWICDPAQPAAMAGAAAAARVAAWLGRIAGHPATVAATVDPARCRACATCIQICEFGAPQLIGDDPQRTSWIDPVICTGCGTCVAHCPSGAITAAYMTEAQLEAMLDAALRQSPEQSGVGA